MGQVISIYSHPAQNGECDNNNSLSNGSIGDGGQPDGGGGGVRGSASSGGDVVGVIDGQHRLGGLHLMLEAGTWSPGERVLAELYPLGNGEDAARLFSQINQAQPVKLVRTQVPRSGLLVSLCTSLADSASALPPARPPANPPTRPPARPPVRLPSPCGRFAKAFACSLARSLVRVICLT